MIVLRAKVSQSRSDLCFAGVGDLSASLEFVLSDRQSPTAVHEDSILHVADRIKTKPTPACVYCTSSTIRARDFGNRSPHQVKSLINRPRFGHIRRARGLIRWSLVMIGSAPAWRKNPRLAAWVTGNLLPDAIQVVQDPCNLPHNGSLIDIVRR